jgi:hypothetical protein
MKTNDDKRNVKMELDYIDRELKANRIKDE